MSMRGIESHLFLSLDLHDLAIVDNDFDRAIPNALDRVKEYGPHIGTRFVGRYVPVFHGRLHIPSLPPLPHDHLLALIPVPEEGKVRVNRVNGILAGDGKEDAGGRDDGFRESILDGRFNADRRKSAFLSGINGMTVCPPGQSMQT